MEKFWLHGNLKQTPLPFLLFRIWKSNRSGRLKIKEHSEEKSAAFLRGQLAPRTPAFSGKDFLYHMAASGHIEENQIQKILSQMPRRSSMVRILLEKELIQSEQLWQDMHMYLEKHLFPVFDSTDAEFFFETDAGEESALPLLILDTPLFILKGIRKMSNFSLMNAHLPLPDADCTLQSSEITQTLAWNAPESYIIRLAQEGRTVNEVCKESELSLNETKRVLFLLHALEMIGKVRKPAAAPEISSAEIQRIYEHFNQLYIHIYKFLSKEMGPVSFKIMEKCIMDIKPYLHSGFHKLSLEATGRIVLGSTPITPAGLPGDMSRDDFLGGLNEILNAEILLVKKTLGSKSESNLIKSLNNLPK